MQVMTTTDLRRNLAAALDAVVDNEEELVVPRDGGTAVVIIDLGTWNSMKETLHVLGNPEQTIQLMQSIQQLNAGQGHEHELLDDSAAQQAESVPAQRTAA